MLVVFILFLGMQRKGTRHNFQAPFILRLWSIRFRGNAPLYQQVIHKPCIALDARLPVPLAFAKTVRRAGPRVPFRFHDLRHVYAVETLRSGTSIYRVSQHLGHTSVHTTEIYLAHLTPDEADRARQ